MIHSIRLTLTTWYVGILALILCLFAWTLYTRVARNLAQDVDNSLAAQVDGIIEAVFAFREVRKAQPTEITSLTHGLKPLTAEEIREEKNLPIMLAYWADQTRALENVHPIRLFDHTGNFVAASKSFDPVEIAQTQKSIEAALKGHATYQTFQLPDHRVRTLTHPVIEDNQLLYIIQAATILKQMDDSLARLRIWLTWLIPVMLAATGLVGWFLTKAALRPVDLVTRQARRISAERLNLRIDVPETQDELKRLAETFNEMLDRLERAFRRLRQFSAAASHELRTPLTAMKGELEITLRRPRTSEEYAQTLQTHLESVNEMQHTVEQLLALARSETGEGAVSWNPIDLGDLIRHSVKSVQMIADAKAVKLKIKTEELLLVKGEQNLLRRLILNLLDNAIRHTPVNSRVWVELAHENRQVRFTVRDEGAGIPSGEQAKIFDHFFSARKPSSENQSTGLGLGLGLCRWIVEAHQGQIELESIPGCGASFTVWLPLSRPSFLNPADHTFRSIMNDL